MSSLVKRLHPGFRFALFCFTLLLSQASWAQFTVLKIGSDELAALALSRDGKTAAVFNSKNHYSYTLTGGVFALAYGTYLDNKVLFNPVVGLSADGASVMGFATAENA